MSSIPSATAHSTTSSFVWNNKAYLALAGLAGIVLFIAYRVFLKSGENSSRAHRINEPVDLSTRYIKSLFPDCANITRDLHFDPVAQAIIRVNLEDLKLTSTRDSLELVYIHCSYRETTFLYQPMTPGDSLQAYIPHLPEKGEKIVLRFIYQESTKAEVTMTVDHVMGIYEIYKEAAAWKVGSHAEPLLKAEGLPYDMSSSKVDSPLSILIHNVHTLGFREIPKSLKEDSYFSFENTSDKTHVLFFQIISSDAIFSIQNHNLVIPIAVLPRSTISLPKNFLRQCWESTLYSIHARRVPSNPNLFLMNLQDTRSSS